GRGAEPDAVSDAGAGHSVNQLFQGTDYASKQVNFGTKLDVSAGGFKFLSVNPDSSRDAVQKAIQDLVGGRGRIFGLEGNFVSGLGMLRRGMLRMFNGFLKDRVRGQSGGGCRLRDTGASE